MSTAITVAIAIALFTDVGGMPNAQEPASSSRAARVDAFHRRVEAYVNLHRRFEEPLPPMTRETGSWSMFLAKRYLASAIRTARSRARQGDIFDPETAAMFRELIAEALANPDADTLHGELRTGVPVHVFRPTINEPYPGVTHEVPPIVLERLPPLPEHVEYRIAGRDLLLWDVHADIVVDFIPDAFAAGASDSP